MTNKDIRDIAAYMGCRFYYDGDRKPWEEDIVLTPESLFNLVYAVNSSEFAGVKLKLRGLGSLTDDELAEVCRLAEIEPGPVQRTPFSISCGTVHIEIKNGELRTRKYMSLLSAAAYAYLQSIAVYIPGMIRPELVQLIEP